MAMLLRWAPAAIMALGAAVVNGLVAPQREMPLRAPLAPAVADSFRAYGSRDEVIPPAEARAAAFDDYLLRVYSPGDTTSGRWVSLYVGYYRSQTQGRTIHSPKNCLPGSGWEPLQSQAAEIVATDGSTHRVNRYILQRDTEQVLVLYWYQGRGRVENNEYTVKLDLLRDAAFRRRTDEALVRIVVPVTGSEEEAFEMARGLAAEVIPSLAQSLPG